MSFREERPGPIEIHTDYFKDAPGDVTYGVAITRSYRMAEGGGILLPTAEAAAQHLIEASYTASGIIGDQENATDSLKVLDHMSERFVVMQRKDEEDLADVFATVRLIHREAGGLALPMEKNFPDVFSKIDPLSCVEISQLYSFHTNKIVHQLGIYALLRAVYAYAQNSNASTIVGMAEQVVLDMAQLIGIPSRDGLGDSIQKQEARDTKTRLHPLAFDVEEISRTYSSGENDILNIYFDQIGRHRGIGWFNSDLTKHLGYPSS